MVFKLCTFSNARLLEENLVQNAKCSREKSKATFLSSVSQIQKSLPELQGSANAWLKSMITQSPTERSCDQAQNPSFAELDWAAVAPRALVNILPFSPFFWGFPNTIFFIRLSLHLHYALLPPPTPTYICLTPPVGKALFYVLRKWQEIKRGNICYILMEREKQSNG